MDMVDLFEAPPLFALLQNALTIFDYPYMRNAFMAGIAVVAMTVPIGLLLILRNQTYIGHTISLVGFPGATGAVLLGISPLLGFFSFAVAAAVVIGLLLQSGRQIKSNSAVIASVQVFALSLGLFFASRYHGFLSNTTTFLFGSFIGISHQQVITLLLISTGTLGLLFFIGRPLLFDSIDREVAAIHGLSVNKLTIVFMVLCGLSVSATSQITGALLVFSLLVGPASIAQLLSLRPVITLTLSLIIGIGIVFASLTMSYLTDYPIGFFITSFAFILYLGCLLIKNQKRLQR